MLNFVKYTGIPKDTLIVKKQAEQGCIMASIKMAYQVKKQSNLPISFVYKGVGFLVNSIVEYICGIKYLQ